MYYVTANWGQSVVNQLAEFLEQKEPGLKGFSNKNLWRMRQFYEIYREDPKVSPLVRQISRTNNLIIFSRAKTGEEREFYLRLCIQEKYGKRELERQLSSSFYEKVMIGKSEFSTSLRQAKNDVPVNFKDSYIFEFLNLAEPYTENDLKKGLIKQMKTFILEIGKDFIFMGEEYKVMIGNTDFYLDLLFFHRGLQCLVAFELKADKFKPEHLGQLNFYLEALDRDVKKQNEKPSIGILLCKDKDIEVVEYALSRSLSPTMVAAYKTHLPDKKLLQRKLHELFDVHHEPLKED
ncbi:YhcG family protein [Pedobacter polysacchareus]|uniref:YhcG family protein n=1 Tax=Pedobacter polysacchareus TaxID=2861973 RepID=UPI0034A2168A